MDVQDVVDHFRESMSVTRVVGAPVQQDGLTLVPVIRIRGGGGGGDADSAGSKGTGSGFGLMAAPAGAWVLREGKVSWRPAVDVNRIILGAQIVALFALWTLRVAIRRKAKWRS